ncbi:MAG: LysM peptidoglycan-binding domain-containing protein [Bacteroidales bacterium]
MIKLKTKIFSLLGATAILISPSCKSLKIFGKRNNDKKTEIKKTAAVNKQEDSIVNTLENNPLTLELDSLNYNNDSLAFLDDSTSIYSGKNENKEAFLRNTGILQDPPMLELLEQSTLDHFYDEELELVDKSKYGNFKPGFIPVVSDTQIKKRLDSLNKQTTIELTFNQEVKKFITIYSRTKRGITSRMLGLGAYYFPRMEEKLAKYDLPLELKYLAIVESALNPTAGSHAGAKGLWQFMYYTGKKYGLNATTLIDDRFDPTKSTDAACRYLRDLYNIYKDWSLALAAYNSGPGNVNKAIRRAGGVKNYWAVWPFLPRETRNYVPAFIAVTYAMNFPEFHNIRPTKINFDYNRVDTVTVKDVLAFDQINEFLKVPISDLKFLNPQFKKGIIPATKGKQYTLCIPREYVPDYMNNEDSLYNYVTKKGIEKQKILKQISTIKNRNIHIVRSGESLGLIARKYRCSVNSLKKWNRIRGTMIKPGQKLVVYGKGAPSYSYSSSSKGSSSSQYHTVRRGENLGSIARKYNTSVDQIKRLNSLRGNTIRINQKLRVKASTSTASNKTYSFPKNGKKVKHTIKSGENLWTIAKKYKGSSVQKIKQLNNIKNTQNLKPGTVIVVDII